MTVLVDTYDIPAHAIMPQLFNAECYEVGPDEVYGRAWSAPKEGKKYTIMKDISPRVLLAIRDIENVVYVFHREMLDEKEYKIIRYYTNELISVEENQIRVVNKKAKKETVFRIECSKTSTCIEYLLRKEERAPRDAPAELSEAPAAKDREEKSASLPFLQVQSEEEVYFPDEEGEEDEL